MSCELVWSKSISPYIWAKEDITNKKPATMSSESVSPCGDCRPFAPQRHVLPDGVQLQKI